MNKPKQNQQVRIPPDLIGKHVLVYVRHRHKDEGIIRKQSFIGSFYVKVYFLSPYIPSRWFKYEEVYVIPGT